MTDSEPKVDDHAALLEAYDQVPYDSHPFSDSRPAYLGALGVLCGLRPAPASRCRVLELGCASGGNLIPLAWYYPDSEFVGIDLSPAQIEVGQALIDATGLQNCQLLAGDLAQFNVDELGFDYVIAHGLYSWVPESLQSEILALCRRALRPGGIAYISYNTLPGWRSRQLTRDLFDWHLAAVDTPTARLAGAQGLVNHLASYSNEDAPGSYLEVELSRIQARPPSYVAHEYLEPTNNAVYFHQFERDAQHAGLRYLCNADLSTGFAELYGALGEAMDGLTDDPVKLEQYLDFAANRSYRQSLLCRDDEPATGFDPARLAGLYLRSDLQALQGLDTGQPDAHTFTAADGETVEVEHPLCKVMIGLMGQTEAAEPGFTRLLGQAAAELRKAGVKHGAGFDDDAQAELLGLIVTQHIEPLIEAPLVGAELSDTPCASRLAQNQVRLGWPQLATCDHQGLDLDPFTRQLLGLLDGSRSVEMLSEEMLYWVLNNGDMESQNKQQIWSNVVDNVDRLLRLFARHGVLESP